MTGRRREGDTISTPLMVGCFQNTDKIIKLVRENFKSVKRIAIIEGNQKGCDEVYMEVGSDKEAEKIAWVVQATPAPIKGVLMENTFDEIINDEAFIGMGGRVIQER